MASTLFYVPQQIVDGPLGLPSGAARVNFYYTDTTSKAPIYADAGMTTPLNNPVLADGFGRISAVYLDSTITYRVKITDALGVSAYPDIDPYTPGQISGVIFAGTTAGNYLALNAGGQIIAASGTGADAGLRTDLAASTGASLIAYVATGAGATTRTVRDKFGDTIDVRDYGAIFDGRDNTLAIQKAVAAAAASPYSKTVNFPAGDTFISANIQLAPFVKLRMQGQTTTRFRKTADFTFLTCGTPGALSGDVYLPGTGVAYESGGISGGWFYHDYGTGAFPPNTITGMVNPATVAVLIDVYIPGRCVFEDMLVGGGAGCFRIWGGALTLFTGVNTYGLWDPSVTALQSTKSGIFIDGNNASSIPTGLAFISCQMGGVISPIRNITWPGGNVSTTTVANIGPLNNLYIRCCEGMYFNGGYIGASSRCGVLLYPRSGAILSAFSLKGTFIDANGLCGLMFNNSDGAVPYQVSWEPQEHNGQANGLP